MKPLVINPYEKDNKQHLIAQIITYGGDVESYSQVKKAIINLEKKKKQDKIERLGFDRTNFSSS